MTSWFPGRPGMCRRAILIEISEGFGPADQDAINALLIEKAREAVGLSGKSGDAGIFGHQ